VADPSNDRFAAGGSGSAGQSAAATVQRTTAQSGLKLIILHSSLFGAFGRCFSHVWLDGKFSR